MGLSYNCNCNCDLATRIVFSSFALSLYPTVTFVAISLACFVSVRSKFNVCLAIRAAPLRDREHQQWAHQVGNNTMANALRKVDRATPSAYSRLPWHAPTVCTFFSQKVEYKIHTSLFLCSLSLALPASPLPIDFDKLVSFVNVLFY